MDHAGGQRPYRDRVDADDLVFLVQHRHHEKLAIDVAEVLAKEHGRIPGTADLGLRVRQPALAHQRDTVDGHTVGPGGRAIWQWEQIRLLRYQ